MIDTDINLKKVVFPAGAGVIPILLNSSELNFRFPRRCGGDPQWKI